jgi:hypothetical protein
MLDDVGQYILDLADNWAAFTGGILSALVLVMERVRKNTISVRLFILLFLVFGFAASSFTTWRNEHAMRMKAEQAPKGRNPAIVHRLQEYYADAAIYFDKAMDAKTDKEFKEAEKSINKWANELAEWMAENMGKGAFVRVVQVSKPLPSFKNVKAERVELLTLLAILRDNLGLFVENPAWDKANVGAAQATKPATAP